MGSLLLPLCPPALQEKKTKTYFDSFYSNQGRTSIPLWLCELNLTVGTAQEGAVSL